MPSPLEFLAYAGLFLNAFISATLIPMGSEVFLAGMVLSGQYSIGLLLAVASVGNVLGAVVNWGLGLWIDRYKHRSWFPVKQTAMLRAEGWYRHYGKWSLLLSWLPGIGDALTVMAGVMRERLWVFIVFVAIAKVARYLVVLGLTMGFL